MPFPGGKLKNGTFKGGHPYADHNATFKVSAEFDKHEKAFMANI